MVEEKFLTINLRKELTKARRVKKACRAMTLLREKIQKMFKGLDVKISKEVNQEVWKLGAKKPKTKLRLKLIKDEKSVRVELGK
jgi:large subunit ribosomal protein L31e